MTTTTTINSLEDTNGNTLVFSYVNAAAFNSDPEDGRFDRVDALLVDALGLADE